MKKLILAASLLVASLAHAQVTPTPITQAKGATFRAVHAALDANNPQTTRTNSRAIDATGYAGALVYMEKTGECSPFARVEIYGSTSSSVMGDLLRTDSATRTVSPTAVDESSRVSFYWVGPVPNFITVSAVLENNNPPAEAGCAVDVYLTPMPFPAGIISTGAYVDGSLYIGSNEVGYNTSESSVSPVVSGGMDTAYGKIRAQRMTAQGHEIVGGSLGDNQDLSDHSRLARGNGDQNPLIVGGYEMASGERAFVRSLKTDSRGYLHTSSEGTPGSPPASGSNPLLMAGSDGVNARTFRTRTDGALITTWQPMVPSAPVTKAMSANTSDAVTGLAAGATVDLFCNTDCNFAAGSGTPVASASDNDIPARSRLRYTLGATQTAVGFICASAGVCRVSTVPAGP